MSGFTRKLRRAQLRRLAVTDALGRGCTCPRLEVRLLGSSDELSRIAIAHDEGCPACGTESVVLLPREGER